MKHIELKGQLREASGKQAIKAIRREGLVPCNLYGLGMENILFTVSAKALKPITNTPNSYIIDLELSNGQKINAVLHELQWHPVTDECLHVDFLAVCDTKPVVSFWFPAENSRSALCSTSFLTLSKLIAQHSRSASRLLQETSTMRA